MMFVDPPVGLGEPAWLTAAVGALMCFWWVTEAVPIPITSLLPLALMPILGIAPIADVAPPYAHPLIFLFMGGFMLSIAMERWELHRRLALQIIRLRGTGPSAIVSGFMVSAAFLSLWVTNTAATLMLLPMATAVIVMVKERAGESYSPNFEVALLLGIAYAATIGGLGTLIGTVPNALLAAFLDQQFDYEISFARWMLLGIPIVVISIPLTYLILTRFVYKIPASMSVTVDIRGLLDALGPAKRAEWMVGTVFLCTATLWIFSPLVEAFVPLLTDAGIAMTAAIVLFVLPVDARRGVFLMDWNSAKRLPWGMLILFGGGLSLAKTVSDTGLALWIGESIAALEAMPTIIILLAVVMSIVFLTELTSNTATTASFLPILAPVALAMGENPLLLLIPATIAASCAFMLPVATPPNAIVYGSDLISIPQMARAGLYLNLLFITLLTIAAYFLLPIVFGVDPGVVPNWAE